MRPGPALIFTASGITVNCATGAEEGRPPRLGMRRTGRDASRTEV